MKSFAQAMFGTNIPRQGEEEEGQGDLAVRGVSLSVQKGEWLSVIGHNGSGKSTLAKLLNGLYLPKKGSVVVNCMDTRDEERIWDIRQKVGMIFQNPDNQIVAHRCGGRRRLWPGKPRRGAA